MRETHISNFFFHSPFTASDVTSSNKSTRKLHKQLVFRNFIRITVPKNVSIAGENVNFAT